MSLKTTVKERPSASSLCTQSPPMTHGNVSISVIGLQTKVSKQRGFLGFSLCSTLRKLRLHCCAMQVVKYIPNDFNSLGKQARGQRVENQPPTACRWTHVVLLFSSHDTQRTSTRCSELTDGGAAFLISVVLHCLLIRGWNFYQTLERQDLLPFTSLS